MEYHEWIERVFAVVRAAYNLAQRVDRPAVGGHLISIVETPAMNEVLDALYQLPPDVQTQMQKAQSRRNAQRN